MRQTKKQVILDYCEKRGFRAAGRREIAEIGEELYRAFGTRSSAAYVARVLKRAGIVLERDDGQLDSALPEPYASRLREALRFHDLESAEASLRKLDAACQEYTQASDLRGVGLVRSLALKGKQRAQTLSRSQRVSTPKRMEKGEIARWFTVWLQNPSLFFDWLELRKRSADFQQNFDKDASAHL
jgi:hypothetical protein